MKHLLLSLMLISVCCNPLDFGSTKLVHLESDQMTKSFECNDNIVADWSRWFEWCCKGGVYSIDKMGIKVLERGDHIVIRFTQYAIGFDAVQTEAVYNSKNSSMIFEIVQDSVLFTNLRVAYE